MRNSLKRTLVFTVLAAVVVLVFLVATVHLWRSLEAGAYRSPMYSETERLTPWARGAAGRAAAISAWVITEDAKQSATLGGAAAAGVGLFQANGCYACHSLEGERKIGPNLRGIFGTIVELNDGSTVPIDDKYIVESILQPEAKRVAGYDDAAMPSYEGLVSIEEVWALAEYIKNLK